MALETVTDTDLSAYENVSGHELALAVGDGTEMETGLGSEDFESTFCDYEKRKGKRRLTTGRRYRYESAVWEFFVYSQERDECKCQVANCIQVLKGKFATNLKKHLRTCHKAEYQDFELKEEARDKRKKPQASANRSTKLGRKRKQNYRKGRSVAIMESATKEVKKRKYQRNKVPVCEEAKEKKLSLQLALLLGSNPSINYSLAQNEDFVAFVKTCDPGYAIPSQEMIEKHIETLETRLRSLIEIELKLAKKITITTDICTKKGPTLSYLGICCHFFSQKSFQKLDVVLNVRKLNTTTITAEDLFNMIKEVLAEYKVDLQKVWRIITDNGCNLMKAVKSLVDLQDYGDDDSPKNQITDQARSQEINDFDVIERELNDYSQAFQFQRMACFTHKIHSALHVILRNSDIRPYLTRVAKFCSTINATLSVNTLLKSWNTVYLMVEHLMELRAHLPAILAEVGVEDMSCDDWNLTESLLEFLKPFHLHTNICSKDFKSVISEVFCIFEEFKANVNDVVSNSIHPELKSVAQDINEQMQMRFNYIFDTKSENFEPAFIAATFLDPRFRVILTEQQIKVAIEYISKNFGPQPDSEVVVYIEPIPVLTNENKGNRFRVVDEKLKQKKQNRLMEALVKPVHTETQLDKEMKFYAEDDSRDTDDSSADPLELWTTCIVQLPHLRAIAQDILSMPASNGLIERIFALEGLSMQRTPYDTDQLERQVFLNRNKYLLK